MGEGINRHAIAIAVTLFIAAGVSPGLFAAQQPATWLGGAGNWTDATKWSGGVVPNNNATDTYNVNVDGGNAVASNVTLRATGTPTAPSYGVDAVSIDAGDRLYINNGSLAATALTVNGTLQLDYTSTVTLPANTTISGTGSILYSLQSSQLAATSGTLTIDTGLTVRGGDSGGAQYFGGGGLFARLGSATTALVNRGTIDADQPGGLILLTATSIDNQGTLRASNGGYLGFQTDFSLGTIGNLGDNGGGFAIFKTLANTGQTLQVNRAGGWILAKGGTIDGGTVATSGTGYLAVPYLNTGTLNNVTLNGNVRIDGDLNITGASGGNGTITINNPEAIEGSGNVFAPTLPNGMTVRGGLSEQFDPDVYPSGFPGDRARVHLTTNQGRIRAQRSIFGDTGRLRLVPDSGDTITNAGTAEISGGGILISLGNFTFAPNSHFVIDGGGEFEINGNLNLTSTNDFLDVLPLSNGSPYSNYLVATYTGTRTGTFDRRTLGITVSYAVPGEIRISGTPVPEPAAVGLSMLLLGGLACRRGRRVGG